MTPNIDPALVERMVQLVRTVGTLKDYDPSMAQYDRVAAASTEARAIVAELPDPDLEAAKQIADRLLQSGSGAYCVSFAELDRAEKAALAGIAYGRANPCRY